MLSGSEQGGQIMARAPGTIYVYRSYGIHQMFNIVARDSSAEHGAILIRALEPLTGIELMRERRGQEALVSLCSGPGKVCQALAIDGSLNGVDLVVESAIQVRRGSQILEVSTGPRIGISKSVELPLRFFATGNRYVSRVPARKTARLEPVR